MASRLQPAFWGGLFIGVLSGLPIVNIGNVCCCLWVVSGGVLAAWLAQSNQPYALRAADGALIGLLAGLIGAVIAFPIDLVFSSWTRDFMLRVIESAEGMPPEMREIFERGPMEGAFARAMTFVISLVVDAVFGMLGGLLGVAIFKKEGPPPPPPGTVEVLPPQY